LTFRILFINLFGMPKKQRGQKTNSSVSLGNALINSKKVARKAHIHGEGPQGGYKVVSFLFD